MSLPIAYQEVEYLESSGTQYIDTGFNPAERAGRFTWETEVYNIRVDGGGSAAMGSRSQIQARNWILMNISVNLGNQLGYGSHTYTLYSDFTSGNWAVSRTLIDNENYKFIIIANNQERELSTPLETFTNTSNVYLFGANNMGSLLSNYPFAGKIKTAKLFDDGALIRDFIPCYRKSDHVAGMYDLVTNTFYTNAGTGSFVVGPNVGENASLGNLLILRRRAMMMAQPNNGKVFGIHINGALSDPDSMVTYLEDAVGMTPAHMDFANDVFDYGSWENAFFLPKPCMLKYDGTVDYYLDPNDYTKKIDGTTSDVSDDTYAGNAMMEWPKIWLKMVPDTDPKSCSIYIANYKADDDFHCWSNINSKGAEVDHFYTPIYNGSIVSSKLRSISGKAYSALCQSKTAQQEIDLAHANNPSTDILWETELYADIQLIQWLLVLISKSLDSASKFGEGRRGQASAASSMLGTGTMDGKGLFWGSNTTTYGVKVFGMENFWGNQWRRYEGHVMVNGVQKIKLTYGQEDGSSTNGYNITGNGYLTADETAPSGTSGGYLSQMLFTDKGSVPQVADGSSTTYFCDGLWFNNSGTMFALRGGHASRDAKVGLFSCHLYTTASYAAWTIGASVSYKPLKQI